MWNNEKLSGGVKTSFNFCLSKILAWEKIKILCNKTIFEEFKRYDKQAFINESWKQEFLDLTGVLEKKNKLKNIYLLN